MSTRTRKTTAASGVELPDCCPGGAAQVVRCISGIGMAESKGASPITHFLNVDLDIYSTDDLQPLVDSLGKKVIVLYVGKVRRKYCAHLELAKWTRSADTTILAFCGLIRGLPKAQRNLWDTATVRDFSIGIQAGIQPNPCDFAIEAKTLSAVSELAARIVLTVYPIEEAATEEEEDPGCTG